MGSTAPVAVVPALATTQKGRRPAARSSRYQAIEVAEIHLEAVVRWHCADVGFADAEHAGGFRDRKVAFPGNIEAHRLAHRRDAFADDIDARLGAARGGEPGKIRHRSAAGVQADAPRPDSLTSPSANRS